MSLSVVVTPDFSMQVKVGSAACTKSHPAVDEPSSFTAQDGEQQQQRRFAVAAADCVLLVG